MNTTTRLLICLMLLCAAFPIPALASPDTSIEYTQSPALAIPDDGCVSTKITVTDAGVLLADLNVGVWIEHNQRYDLSIRLTSPSGTTVGLFNHNQYSGINLNALFDDSASGGPNSVIHPSPPPNYPNSWMPAGRLFDLAGESLLGDWELTVCDNMSGDIGTLQAWSLFMTTGEVAMQAEQTKAVGCVLSPALYTLTVVNATDTPVTMDLNYSTSGWDIDGPASTPELAPGERWTFNVSHFIPEAASPGDTGTWAVNLPGGSPVMFTTTYNALIAESVGDMPAAAAAHSVVYVDGKLYVIGGFDSTVTATSAVWIYDTISETWRVGASLPQPLGYIECAAIGDKIYCAGGMSMSGGTSAQLLIYDISADGWSSGAAMSRWRYQHAAVALDGKFYVIGGMESMGESATILEYDPATNAWNYGLAPMAAARYGFAAGVVGGKIYVAGGVSGTEGEVYDPAVNSWTALPAMPQSAIYAGDAVLQDRYLLIFNLNPISLDVSTIMIYDAVQNAWRMETSEVPAIAYLSAAGDGEQVWAMGGIGIDVATTTFSLSMFNFYACSETCTAPDAVTFRFAPLAPNAGRPVTFGSIVSGGSRPFTYVWDFGEGPQAERAPTHVFSSPGPYPVSLTVNSCAGPLSVSRTVHVLAPSSLDVQPGSLALRLGAGQTGTQTLEVCNLGDDWLFWSAAPQAGWLGAGPVSGLLVNRGCTSLNVTFDASALDSGVYTTTLELQGANPTDGALVIPVELTVENQVYLPMMRTPIPTTSEWLQSQAAPALLLSLPLPLGK